MNERHRKRESENAVLVPRGLKLWAHGSAVLRADTGWDLGPGLNRRVRIWWYVGLARGQLGGLGLG